MWKHLTETLGQYGETLAEKYKQVLEERGINASGTLAQSVRYIVETPDDRVFELSLGLEEYYKYIEDGRQPGKYPPPEAIESWIEIKPIAPYAMQNGKVPGVRELAFLIGRKIATEGIEAKHPLGDSIEEIQDYWLAEIDNAITLDINENIDEILSIL